MKATRWSMIAFCSLASVLTVANLAQAQVRISVGVGPTRVGYSSYGYGRGYYGPGPYYGPRYYYPSPVIVSPSIVVPSTRVIVAQPEPTVIASSSPAGGATIRVILPDPNAQVLFDGAPTRQTGTERTFHTPPLAAGAPNTYRIRATWNGPGGLMAREQVVPVTPGQQFVVDFARSIPSSEGVPLPR